MNRAVLLPAASPAVKLSAFRAEMGMPQRAAAVWLGVSHRTIARWEKGSSVPLPAHQRKIQRLTKGRVALNDWLGGGSGNRREISIRSRPDAPEI